MPYSDHIAKLREYQYLLSIFSLWPFQFYRIAKTHLLLLPATVPIRRRKRRSHNINVSNLLILHSSKWCRTNHISTGMSVMAYPLVSKMIGNWISSRHILSSLVRCLRYLETMTTDLSCRYILSQILPPRSQHSLLSGPPSGPRISIIKKNCI